MAGASTGGFDPAILEFFELMGHLKDLRRTGWIREGIRAPESLAAHMYRVSCMVLLAQGDLDQSRCVLMAQCHDMAESVAGDVPTYQNMATEHKRKLEQVGFAFIESQLRRFNPDLASKIVGAWNEYEARETPEAKFVHDMDKFDCMLQAHEYEKEQGMDLEGFQKQGKKLMTPMGRDFRDALGQKRKQYFARGERAIRVGFVIGDPPSDLPTEIAPLCKSLDIEYISMRQVLEKRSEDSDYRHADFLKICFREGVDCPSVVKVDLLRQEVDASTELGRKRFLIEGFPASTHELKMFEGHVHRLNHALCFESDEGSDSTQAAVRPTSRVTKDGRHAEVLQNFVVDDCTIETHMQLNGGNVIRIEPGVISDRMSVVEEALNQLGIVDDGEAV